MAIISSRVKVPTLRESIAIAAIVAVVSFMFIHHYNPARGPLANIMSASIYFTDACPYVSPYEASPSPPPADCGEEIPYRWVVAALVIFMAFCWYQERRGKP